MINDNLQGKMIFSFFMTQRYLESLPEQEKQIVKRHMNNWFVQGRSVERKLKDHLHKSNEDYEAFEEESYCLMDIIDYLFQLSTEDLINFRNGLYAESK